jgi:hypothetical protein
MFLLVLCVIDGWDHVDYSSAYISGCFLAIVDIRVTGSYDIKEAFAEVEVSSSYRGVLYNSGWNTPPFFS